jgi:DNA-binding PadR family transcriptional regulator
MPINLINKSPSIRILEFLKDSKSSVTYEIIRRYIPKFTDRQIVQALDRLYKLNYIDKSGTHKRNIYSITDLGLDYLFSLEKKTTAINVSNFVFNYLLKIGIGLD